MLRVRRLGLKFKSIHAATVAALRMVAFLEHLLFKNLIAIIGSAYDLKTGRILKHKYKCFLI